MKKATEIKALNDDEIVAALKMPKYRISRLYLSASGGFLLSQKLGNGFFDFWIR